MKKRNLNLDQLKVRSFVTTVDKSHQIAAKGGATYDAEWDSCVLDEVVVISKDTRGGGGGSNNSCIACNNN